MKRVMTLLTAAAILAGLLAGCGNRSGETERTPEEWTALYSDAVTASRSQEDNDTFLIVSSAGDDMGRTHPDHHGAECG